MTTIAATNDVGAFFDMDKTLLSVSSATLWARHMRERGELPLGDLLRIVSALVRYKLGQLDMAETTQEVRARVGGPVGGFARGRTRGAGLRNSL